MARRVGFGLCAFFALSLERAGEMSRGMVRACRPRGAIVVEDIDFSGSFCYPHCAAYKRYVELYQKVV